MGSCLANANSKIFFACGAHKKAFGLRLPSLKAQSRAKLGRSEFVAKWSCAFREQTDSRPQEDQEEDQGDQGREEEKVWCTLSESIDSIYLWKYISQ